MIPYFVMLRKPEQTEMQSAATTKKGVVAVGDHSRKSRMYLVAARLQFHGARPPSLLLGVVHSTSSTFAEPLSRSLERPLLGTAAVSLCRRLGGSALVDEAPRLSAVSCAQISHHCAHMSAMKNVEPSAFCVDVPSRHAYVVHYAQ